MNLSKAGSERFGVETTHGGVAVGMRAWHAERRGLGLSCSALRLRICTSPNDTVLHNMKTNLSFSTPAEVETECLVAVVLDRGEKERTEAFVATNEKAVAHEPSDVNARWQGTGKK